MCGLAGYIWKDRDRPANSDAVREMTDIMIHRGPDDEGYWSKGPVALGHRRLSIIDLSPAGRQPMIGGAGRYVVVYNGEIYNYLELRLELEDNWRFTTDTDTEVLIAAYERWGYDCVRHFNGMWSFALYDLEEGKIFFSRDRFGIKPFYYADRPGCFIFSSEIKAILKVAPEVRKANEPVIHHFLPSGVHDDGPETFFKEVYQLQPAHNAVYDLSNSAFREWRYWDLDQEAFRDKWLSGDPVEKLYELLESSVRLHMRSDVPVGTCLSGGVDSSTIVGLMSRLRNEPVHTFSGLYEDRFCDESEYTRAVNARADTIPCPVRPEPDGNLLEDLRGITWHQDEPSAGPGLYTQYHVMKRASGEVKVILDGQGGDELFAGYIPYFFPHLKDLTGAGPGGLLKAVLTSAAIIRYWGAELASGSLTRPGLGKMVRRVTPEYLGNHLQKALDGSPGIFHGSFLDRVNNETVRRTPLPRMSSRLNQALYYAITVSSLRALLRYEDRNSMAYSIEARVPLLDYRIVEFALALDSDYKIRGSWTKWVLRKAAERVIPEKVAWRRSKMGYPTPFARWLRKDTEKEQIEGVLLSKSFREREIVPDRSINYYWKSHQAGRDYSWLLYRLISLELWHQHFIDDLKPNPAKRSDQAGGNSGRE